MNEVMYKLSAQSTVHLGILALGASVFAAVLWENMPATAFFLIACALAYMSQMIMTVQIEYLIAGSNKVWLMNAAIGLQVACFAAWLIGLFNLV